ncbi:hypothetical protein K3495_g14980 [Podosphaera aphanis]|nr:hypothetical protein K3495_g14980 [Podosphaera aphanis]
MSGFSKADREIIAQGSNAEQLAKERRLLGAENIDKFNKTSGCPAAEKDIKGKGIENHNTNDYEPGSSTERGRMKKDVKGKNIDRPTIHEENYLDEDQSNSFFGGYNPGESLQAQGSCKPQKTTLTALDWSSFDWKPHTSNFLRSINNWATYKDSIILQLECIGHEQGIKLAKVDE